MAIRLERKVRDEYEKWLAHAAGDADLVCELRAMQGDEAAIYEAFYSEIEFGTSGLRSVIGAGTNRMNIYTVARATQGLANYLKKNFEERARSVAISYDSRVKSDLFAETVAGVFAANGIKTFIYREIMPVPCLSYAVRELRCAAGVMITASHNPVEYNGYKVYNSDGCQITTRAAGEIFSEIERVDMFADVKKIDFKQGMDSQLIEYISDSVFSSYTKNVLAQSLEYDPFAKTINERSFIRADFKSPESISCAKEVLINGTFSKEIKIVYSPLHGTGYVPVTTVLNKAGYENVNLVEEQITPDGSFPTCSYPNPENLAAMQPAIKLASGIEADIVLSTDPDCDRVGVAVRCLKEVDGAKTDGYQKDEQGENREFRQAAAISNEEHQQLINAENTVYEYRALTGNEIGILLLDYICLRRTELGTMPERPVFFKTIVTSDLAATVAAHYGVETRNVLTGFKFIGEQIGFLEEKGETDRFIFGFEESYGYLAGSYVRDKDGVVASLLICEMAAYYKALDKTLTCRLDEIYEKHGYCLNSTHSFDFPGAAGFEKMKEIMTELRKAGDEPVCRAETASDDILYKNEIESGRNELLIVLSDAETEKNVFSGSKSTAGALGIIEKIDYMDGIDDLPKADVIKFILEDGCSVIIRPSGTEPKIKVYLSVRAKNCIEAVKTKDYIFSKVKQSFA